VKEKSVFLTILSIRIAEKEIEDRKMTEKFIGLIGGTGLGGALGEHISDPETRRINTPFGKPSGDILVGSIGNNRIAFINRHGAGHEFNPSCVPYAANIYALKQLGVTAVIASGAVGSLQEQIKPKELVVVDQIIDKTFKRQTTFFDDYGAVHCELAQPYCGRLRKALIAASANIETTTHENGTYVCMEGPQFSTRAESLMHRKWGADLIGMTAMPEAKLAREAQMCFVLVALISDYDCWREQEANKDKQTLLAEIIGNVQAATNNAIELIKAMLETDGDLCSDDCPCRKSLELAVWTEAEEIDEKHNEMMKILKR